LVTVATARSLSPLLLYRDAAGEATRVAPAAL
jgi:hypothetical protein